MSILVLQHRPAVLVAEKREDLTRTSRFPYLVTVLQLHVSCNAVPHTACTFAIAEQHKCLFADIVSVVTIYSTESLTVSPNSICQWQPGRGTLSCAFTTQRTLQTAKVGTAEPPNFRALYLRTIFQPR